MAGLWPDPRWQSVAGSPARTRGQPHSFLLKGSDAHAEEESETYVLKSVVNCAIPFLTVVLSWTGAECAEQPESSKGLNVAAVSRLTNEPVNVGLPVHARATVIQFSPWVYHFFVRDNGGAVYVSPSQLDWKGLALSPGDVVEIDGVTGKGGYSLDVLATGIQVIERSKPPVAIKIPLNQVGQDRWNCNLVEVEGEIVSVEAGPIGSATAPIIAVTLQSGSETLVASA